MGGLAWNSPPGFNIRASEKHVIVKCVDTIFTLSEGSARESVRIQEWGKEVLKIKIKKKASL